MLSHIYISNFTIIETLDLELSNGLTILTGETGAGKSIMLDAMQLALGDRVDGKVVRQGAKRCEIILSFDIKNNQSAQKWLTNQQLDSDNDCVIRRVIDNDGRSRSTINGTPCPLQQIRQLGNILINIHGQHEHHALLKRDKQRSLLDNFAQHQNLCEKVETIYEHWRTLSTEFTQLRTQNRAERLDLLRYQVKEFDEIHFSLSEFQQLEQEHKQLANAEQLLNNCQHVLDLSCKNEDNSITSQLYDILKHLEPIKKIDKRINNASELFQQALIQTEEASNELTHYLDVTDLNPERLQTVEKRLNQIHDLARKHHVPPEQLADIQQALTSELSNLEHADEKLAQLQDDIAKCIDDYRKTANKLTKSRQKAAKKFSERICEKIQHLGMPGGRFSAMLIPQEIDTPTAYGAERIEFLVGANPGQPLGPLNKVASGGELSRISLAIQVIAAEQQTIPTLIFDEVDVGIGGGTAQIVGQLLRQLGETAQLFCITHLPQVAAQGHHHLKVAKQSDKETTVTQITTLTPEEKIQEIARMLGGVNVTSQTLAHAKEMLEWMA